MEFSEFIAPLKKWRWLIISATLLSLILGFIVSSRRPPTYRASTTLIIGSAIEDPNPSNTEFYLGQQLSITYAEIAEREPVRNATKNALQLTRLPKYEARPIPTTPLLLEIIVTDTDPKRAQAVANELANQLILQSPSRVQQEEQQRQKFISQQLNELETQIQQTLTEIIAKQNELADMDNVQEIQTVQNDLNALHSKLSILQTSYANLLLSTQSGATNALNIIEPAILPTQPSGPGVLYITAIVGSAGLLLSSGAAFLLVYLDNTIQSPDDVNAVTNLPVLAGIARIKGDDASSKLVTVLRPRSPVSEVYRKLRTAIQFASIDHPHSTSLLITSSNPSEGKSVTTANLGVVMAQAGNRVLVVDADLRRPTQHHLFQLSNGRGLSTFLLKMGASNNDVEVNNLIEQTIQPTSVEGLYVMACGPIPPNPSELLGSTKMEEALRIFEDSFDFLVIDSSPIIAVTDAMVLSAQVDGVLLVAQSGRTQRTHLKQVVAQLRDAKVNIIGVLMNKISSGSDGYYYYYYYHQKYNHYYTDSENGGKARAGFNGNLLKNIIPRRKKEKIND